MPFQHLKHSSLFYLLLPYLKSARFFTTKIAIAGRTWSVCSHFLSFGRVMVERVVQLVEACVGHRYRARAIDELSQYFSILLRGR